MRVNSSRRRRAYTLVVPLLILLSGCMSHTHVVGVGSSGVRSESMRQYYLFFGFLPLNEVNVQRETGDLTGYEIYSEYGFWDIVLSPLLFFVTGTSRTVTVSW